ncbi:MAG: hypothetical protein R3261_08630 [Alphaproteobacteria bacterium]|nr:hypothetical protein [Alphaproteobacteria bacterium]
MLRTVATTFALIFAVFVLVSITSGGAPFSSPAAHQAVSVAGQ